MLSQIRRDIIDYNPDEKIKVLAFEMEMLGVDQVTRDISSKVLMSTKQLYSAEDNEELSNEDLRNINEVAEKMKSYPIYIVDEVGTVKEIIETILSFVQNENLVETETGLVLTFDHTLLVRSDTDQDEKQVVDSLYRALVRLKKYFETIGLKCLMILLSQLNRNIESTERIINPKLQYPNKTDIFASSAAFYCSDYVIVTHKPLLIEGIGEGYGPARLPDYPTGLPVICSDTGKPMIYWHIIKGRFSTNKILMMLDDFANSRILEYNKPQTNP